MKRAVQKEIAGEKLYPANRMFLTIGTGFPIIYVYMRIFKYKEALCND